MSSSRQNCNVQDFKSFGVWCGNFYVCKLCATNLGSSEFKNVTELSEHIKDLHVSPHYENKLQSKNMTFIENEYSIKCEENEDIDMVIDQDNKLDEHNLSINESDEEENENNQCNICGKTFDENLCLKLHVEDMHNDYYFDEENSLLLKEALTSKEYSFTKCSLCLENFKMQDLKQHIISLHPTELGETINDIKNVSKTESFCEVNLMNVEHIKNQGSDNMINSHELDTNYIFNDVALACEDKQSKSHGIEVNQSQELIDKDLKYVENGCKSDVFENVHDLSYEYYYIEEFDDTFYDEIIEPKIIELLEMHGIFQDGDFSDQNENIEYDDPLLILINQEYLIPDISYNGLSIQQEIDYVNLQYRSQVISNTPMKTQNTIVPLSNNNIKSLNEISKSKQKVTSFTCNNCNKIFKNETTLIKHIKPLHKMLASKFCNNLFVKKIILILHLTPIHEVLFTSKSYKQSEVIFLEVDNLGNKNNVLNKSKAEQKWKNWKKRRK